MSVKQCTLVAVSVVLALGIALSGSAASAPEKRTITIGGADETWVSARIKDGLMAEVTLRHTPYGVKIRGGLGALEAERYKALQDGVFDLTNDCLGYTGLQRILGKLSPDLASRFQYLALFPEKFQPLPLIVYQKLPFNSLKECIETKYPIKVGTTPGVASEIIGFIWKCVGGASFKDVIAWGGRVHNTTTPHRIPALLREGVLNAYMCHGSTHEVRLEEVHSVRPLKCLPVAEDEKDLQLIRETYREMVRYVMKPGHYSFITKDTPVVGLLKFYIGSPMLSDEVAYTITKAIWDEKVYLGRAHSEFRDLTPEIIRMAKEAGVPFHPGAERFYREAGIL